MPSLQNLKLKNYHTELVDINHRQDRQALKSNVARYELQPCCLKQQEFQEQNVNLVENDILSDRSIDVAEWKEKTLVELEEVISKIERFKRVCDRSSAE